MSVTRNVGPDTVVSRNEEPVAVEVDGTVVMMSIEQGMYFGLEGVGPRIWALLEGRRSVRDVCAELSGEFEVDAATCEREVLAFLEELRSVGLIVIHGDGDETTAADAG